MRFIVTLACLVCCAPASASGQAPRVSRPVEPVPSVKVEVYWVETRSELNALAEVWMPDETRLGVSFAVLTKTNDDYTCRIVSMKPSFWDSPRMDVIGHELMHCLGYDHS